MRDQFSSYSDVVWNAVAEPQFIALGGKIPINPDVENFKLERFKDTRKDPRPTHHLMLRGSSKTIIFIDGPDSRLDEIIKRLPKYIGQSWLQINKMSLEKDFLNCGNAFLNKCDQWIKDNMMLDEYIPGEKAKELESVKANEICSKCNYFEFDPK